MNLKSITAPLADKIGSLVTILSDLLQTVKEQKAVQVDILRELKEIHDKLEGNNYKPEKKPE